MPRLRRRHIEHPTGRIGQCRQVGADKSYQMPSAHAAHPYEGIAPVRGRGGSGLVGTVPKDSADVRVGVGPGKAARFGFVKATINT
jgi:hypothetical protein